MQQKIRAETAVLLFGLKNQQRPVLEIFLFFALGQTH